MNPKALVVPALLVLAGIAGFLLIDRSDAAPAPLASGSGNTAAAAASSPAAKADVASASLPAAPPESTTAAGDPGRTAVPVAPNATDTVTVRGRLVDRNGAPRPDVAVTLRTWQGADPFELVDLPPLRRLGRDRDDGELPTWTTRADGTFVVPLAKDRTGHLGLAKDDLVFAKDAPLVRGRDGDTDLGDVVALLAGSLAGVVHDERGLPVAGVKVALSLSTFGFGESSSTTTGDDGAFALGRLRPGPWTLRTASGRFLPTVQQVELAPEQRRTGLVVVVRPGNAIAGQVVDDRGVGVAGIKVGSKRKEVRGGVDIERFTPDEATTTDANGFFTLAGLAEETASVRAFGPGHSSATVADVAVGTGNLVLRVDRLGAVEGVLLGMDGTPIAGSRVRARAVSASTTAGGPFGEEMLLPDELDLDGPMLREGALTAADGTFRVESVRPGSVTVVARGDGHRPVRMANVDVRPAQTTTGVRLLADLGATAKVRVVDEAGAPVPDATVRAMRLRDRGPAGNRFVARAVAVGDADGELMVDGGERLGTATSGADGIATIAGLPSGELQLEGTHSRFAPAAPVRATLPKSGTVETSLTLREPGIAAITVIGRDGAPQAGVEVQIVPDDATAGIEPRRGSSGEGGLLSFESLPAGTYTAALTRPKGTTRVGDAMIFLAEDMDTIAASRQPFTITAGATTPVELRRPMLARLHGIVRGNDRPAAGIVVELSSAAPDAAAPFGFGGRNTTTDATGAYEFADVEPGPYELQFGKPDQVVKGRHALDVPPNTPDLAQDLALRTGSVRVQVVARGTDDGVEKAEVELVRADAAAAAAPRNDAGAAPRVDRRVTMIAMTAAGGEGGETTTMRLGQQRALTDEDGVAVIDDVPVGDYTIRIVHRKHAPVVLTDKAVVERQVTDCGRVEVDAAGIVRGKVAGADGKAARMALVWHRLAGAKDWNGPQFAQNGAFRVQGLAGGKYVLRAQRAVPAGGGPPPYGPEVEVDVVPGEIATVELKLPGS